MWLYYTLKRQQVARNKTMKNGESSDNVMYWVAKPIEPVPKNFFLKFFGGHKSFSWFHWYPCFGLLVTFALGFKARVDFLLAHFLAYVLFLRSTSGGTPFWLYRDQHGSRTFLMHIPADVSASIGGGLGLKTTTLRAAHSKQGAVNHLATPARLFPKTLK